MRLSKCHASYLARHLGKKVILRNIHVQRGWSLPGLWWFYSVYQARHKGCRHQRTLHRASTAVSVFLFFSSWPFQKPDGVKSTGLSFTQILASTYFRNWRYDRAIWTINKKRPCQDEMQEIISFLCLDENLSSALQTYSPRPFVLKIMKYTTAVSLLFCRIVKGICCS